MGKIIDPTGRLQPAQTLGYWLDSFTCVQECAADAADNSEIRRSVADNVRLLQSRVKENADPQALALLEQQELIQRQMFARKPEIHHELMKIWLATVHQIKAFSWNLTEPVHYAEVSKGGKIVFWQGDAEQPPQEDRQVLARGPALMAIKFLKFVSSNSGADQDPRVYTQQMLMKQGITKKNFHLYADQLAFPNPWTN